MITCSATKTDSPCRGQGQLTVSQFFFEMMSLHRIAIVLLCFLLRQVVILGQNSYKWDVGALVQEMSPLFFSKIEETRFIVLTIHRLGLANRLRSIADWYVIAQQTGRKLLVTWAITSDCSIAFAELYSVIPPDLTVISHDYGDMLITVNEAMQRRNISSFLIEESFVREGFVVSSQITSLTEQVVLVPSARIGILEHYPCQHYVIKRSEFYASLVPVVKAQELVDHLMQTYFNIHIPIGIHIRTHEEGYDWAIVPPMYTTKANEFGHGATVDDFASVMEEIQRHFAVQTNEGEKKCFVRFLIVSNNQTVKDEMQSRFGPLAIALQGSLERGSADGMLFAFIEFLALSRMSFIVHTHYSTFAQEAAYVHRVPLVSIWEGKVLYMDDIRLPLCGHEQYIRAYGKSLGSGEIEEGTTDKRKVSIEYHKESFCLC
ncbi:hypothetical protein EON65_31365 [archaeon]|nr:MAG: hypothetical protein EON65_31365 [archaeon]